MRYSLSLGWFRFQSGGFMAWLVVFCFGFVVAGFSCYFQKMKKKPIYTDHVLKTIEANNKTGKVNGHVSKWLDEVEKLLMEKTEIETESSSLSTMQKDVQYNEILTKAKALNTQQPSSNPIPDAFGDIEWFTSTKEAFQLVLEALHGNTSYIVGLYGKQGIGKTKLVKFVSDYKGKFLKNFDRVVFATVPDDQDVKKMQVEIAKQLNLESDGCCEFSRAAKILTELELESEKLSLVILDGVWAELDLLDIGIPRISKKCKVLLTTRSLQVCHLMECDRQIPLKPLNDEEAWIWFKKHVPRIDDEFLSNILNLAKEKVVECNGIPQRIKEVVEIIEKKKAAERIELERRAEDFVQKFNKHLSAFRSTNLESITKLGTSMN